MVEQALEIPERVLGRHEAYVLRVPGLVRRDGEGDEGGRPAEDGLGRFRNVREAEAALCGADGVVGEEGDERGVRVLGSRFEQGGEGFEGLG